jgi:SSS family solute:Na+ symporter
MDFVHTRAPGLSQRSLMWIGRGVTLVFMLLAMLWAPQITHFGSLFSYLQEVLAYAVSPVVAVLVVGVFSRRATADGAIAALLAGFAGGAVLFTVNVVLQLTQIHFLYVPAILFVLSFGVLLLVSRFGVPPVIDAGLLWSGWRFPSSVPQHGGAWYSDFRVQAVLLLLFTAFTVLTFA